MATITSATPHATTALWFSRDLGVNTRGWWISRVHLRKILIDQAIAFFEPCEAVRERLVVGLPEHDPALGRCVMDRERAPAPIGAVPAAAVNGQAVKQHA